MKYLFSFVGKVFFFLIASFFIVGCSGTPEQQQEKAAEEIYKMPHFEVEKPEFTIQLPEYWKEIHPSSYTEALFQQQKVYSLFKREQEEVAYLVVTREEKKDISALEFFSATRENTRAAIFGFTHENQNHSTLSGKDTQFLKFTGQKSAKSNPLQFWQMATVTEGIGLVFTAATAEDISSETDQEILGILSTLTF